MKLIVSFATILFGLNVSAQKVVAPRNSTPQTVKIIPKTQAKEAFHLNKKEDELKPAIANAWVGKYRDVYQPPTGWIGDKPVHKMVRGKGYNDNTIRR